jgi:hypothetical protein
MNRDATKPSVTRDVEPAALRELMDAAPRATVAFTDGAIAELLPAHACFRPDTWLFAVVAEDAPDLDGREVVVAIDDGPYWFELRGISIRGVARRAKAPPSRPEAGLTWYLVEPQRVLAWDYAALRRA